MKMVSSIMVLSSLRDGRFGAFLEPPSPPGPGSPRAACACLTGECPSSDGIWLGFAARVSWCIPSQPPEDHGPRGGKPG